MRCYQLILTISIFLLGVSSVYSYTRNDSEFATSSTVREGYIIDSTLNQKKIKYSVIDNNAVFEGDIIIGTSEEMENLNFVLEIYNLSINQPENFKLPKKFQDAVNTLSSTEPFGFAVPHGIGIPSRSMRWPNKTVPYIISPSLPFKQRVTGAIQHWEKNTVIKFVKRTNEKNYVKFVRPTRNVCSSNVGMIGGEQIINLGDSCAQGTTIHEIGHAVGLWHEQSREDRDNFIEIIKDNILAESLHNFDQHITDGDDIGRYDYGSLMHYPNWAFAIDESKPTIVSKPPGIRFGQRNTLSAGDISAVAFMYP